jgi:integrase
MAKVALKSDTLPPKGVDMRPKKTRKPFTLYAKKTQDGSVWYARYWNESAEVHKKPLSFAYVDMNHKNVRCHLKPFPGFKGIALETLTAGIIRDWIQWAADNGIAGRTINIVLQAMRVPVKYAIEREELDRDPFRAIKKAPEERREKGILSPAEVSRLIAAPVKDPRTRLALLLGALCGLRRGEVRGLQWGDISEGLITVCHNFQDGEGIKAPKCGSARTVPVPGSVETALEKVRALYGGPASGEFVIAGPASPGQPVSPQFFQRGIQAELAAIGIPAHEQKARNLSFHGLRHTYVTLGRLAGITDLEIRALAGHKTAVMMDHYSHATQVLDFAAAREKLESAIEKGAV